MGGHDTELDGGGMAPMPTLRYWLIGGRLGTGRDRSKCPAICRLLGLRDGRMCTLHRV
jgi:hypothetical protein